MPILKWTPQMTATTLKEERDPFEILVGQWQAAEKVVYY
jgi:hypothetical protein